MTILAPVDPGNNTGKSKLPLNTVQQRTGRIPSMVGLMANSPATLDAYLRFASALVDAKLGRDIRHLIAVVVAHPLKRRRPFRRNPAWRAAPSLGNRQGFSTPSAARSKPPRQCQRAVPWRSFPLPNDRLGERANGWFSGA